MARRITSSLQLIQKLLDRKFAGHAADELWHRGCAGCGGRTSARDGTPAASGQRFIVQAGATLSLPEVGAKLGRKRATI
ncbi:MAG: hypothetical protein U0Y68_11060 [Blastocatellia bacterium]